MWTIIFLKGCLKWPPTQANRIILPVRMITEVVRVFSFSRYGLFLVLIFSSISLHAQLAINELNSKGGFTDETGDDVDWIEVFNYSADSLFLADYFLSDDPDNLDKWQFPNRYLRSQELITICASAE